MLFQRTIASSPCESGRFHKSLPTCTVSLAHARVVCEMDKSQSDVSCAPQLSVHSYKPNEINVIPFPSSRPLSLPLPPRTHALLRTSPMTTDLAKRSRTIAVSPLSPKPKFVAPPMHRRRSRDPNVADRLVVELDDDHTSPPRPCSPSPDPQEQAVRGKSDIDHAAPPAYSTLPPPYSATSDEKKDPIHSSAVVVEKDEVSLFGRRSADLKPALAPPPRPSSSSSTGSSSKKTRVSTSELRVLVYLYRTVVYGLELRNRKEKESAPASSSNPTRPTSPTKKKPLGPRSSPSASPISRTASLIPPPEDKFRFESALAAASARAKRISRHSQAGFAEFPLVEDDLDSDKDSEYVTPKTPFHSPSQSPRSSPPPFLRPSPSLDAVASHFASKPKKEKTKAEINAELHVQDALLALRLKEFLQAQGVCEEDLKVDFDEEGRVIEPEKAKIVDEPKKESVVQAQQQEDEESNILDQYFMGIEEEETSGPTKKDRGPVVEDDEDSPFVEEDDLDMDMDNSSSSSLSLSATPSLPPLPVLRVATLAQRVSSPPPTSPSPRPHAVLPTSYMVALLTMRVRHPTKKPGSSSTSCSNNGSLEKGKESKVKRKSGLSVVVEVD